MPTYNTSTVDNIVLGACNVTFGALNLGYTKGGVEVAITTETYTITVDQFGSTSVNEFIMGRNVTVTCPLAEYDLAKLLVAFPGSTVVSDGVTPTKKKLNVPTGAGLSLRSVAQQLVLHPTALSPSDRSQDFTVPIASPKGEMTFSFKHDEEHIYNVEFIGYPDLTTNHLFVIGDTTATP